jgi:predicted  nucleic acid-binding Zn-ribbon protein
MIHQTVEAIEKQLKKKEEQIRIMEKRKSTKYYDLNNAAREIRFLNSLLYKLKNAARQATDFIVNLWKQYVSKIG